MKLNFRRKLFLTFLGFSAFLSACLIGLVYRELRGLPTTATRELLMSTIAQAAGRVDPDDVRAVRADVANHQSPAFRRLVRLLNDIDRSPPHFGPGGRRAEGDGPEKDVYLLVRAGDPGMGMLLVDVKPEDIGKSYVMSRFPEMMAGWDGPSADHQITSDEYGPSLSAYAPVRDESGHAVALLGMDAPAKYIVERDNALVRGALLALGLSLGASTVFALLVAWRLNRSVGLLHRGMERVAGGDLDARLDPPGTGDELAALARRFNEMLDGLKERQRLKRDLALAKQVQQHLLPQSPPAVRGLEIAAGSSYCDETGGDYFDFFELDPGAGNDGGNGRASGDDTGSAAAPRPGRLGVAVADVAGHGVASALLMASIRGVLRGTAALHGDDLPALFRRLNAHLLDSATPAQFVTLFYGVIDPARRTLSWASAGHGPALLCRPRPAGDSGVGPAYDITPFQSTGIPLGIDAGVEHLGGGCVELRGGDVLLIGTDGITESRDPAGDLFGDRRLHELVRSHAGATADEIHRAVLDAACAFRGKGRPEDDMTLVVIKVTGQVSHPNVQARIPESIPNAE